MGRVKGSKNKPKIATANSKTTVDKPKKVITRVSKPKVEKEYINKTKRDFAVDALHRAGKREYICTLDKRKQAASAAIKAMCFVCCGYYLDGANDCGIHDCPLYPWMPYGEGKTWFDKSRKGRKKSDGTTS